MSRTPYTTIALVENYLIRDIHETFQSQVEAWILAVGDIMDSDANRKLVADTYDSDESFELKYFDCEKYGYLVIDDCVAVESVESKEGDTWSDTDYELYPALAPHRKLTGSFPLGLQKTRVRAHWGYFEEIPQDLQFAATVFAAGICLANMAASGENPNIVLREKIGNYEVAYGDGKGSSASMKDYERAKEIVESYRKIEI